MSANGRMGTWQSEGIRLGGVLVDAARIVQNALPRIKNEVHREEIQAFLQGGPMPSQEALKALEAAVIAVSKQSPK